MKNKEITLFEVAAAAKFREFILKKVLKKFSKTFKEHYWTGFLENKTLVFVTPSITDDELKKVSRYLKRVNSGLGFFIATDFGMYITLTIYFKHES